MFSLKDKTILITGASSGLGRQIAIDCAKMGASVVITARNVERLNDTLSMLEGKNNKAIIADIATQEGIEEIAEEIPNLDGIVHCAGINKTMPCAYIKQEDFSNIIKVNLEAPIMLQKAVLKKKKLNAGGSVVFISSIASKHSLIGNSAYSASKSGINSYAKILALELAPKKIRSNCILPGMIDTEFLEKIAISKEQFELDKSKYPLGRYGQPSDISPLAVYLLSNASSWMTGSEIVIDGGRTL